MLPILYAVFPKEYKRFIEVFGGSGAVLLGHEPVDFEVYNDVDGELVNCFRVIRNRPASFLLELGMLPLNSREEFASWLKFQNPGSDPVIYLKSEEEIMDRLLRKEWAEPLKEAMHMRADYPEVLRAANYLKRVRNSYSSSGRSFAFQPFNICTLFDQIWEMSARLANVVVEQQSFEVLIPHYDRPDSFFYADPPYYNSEYVYEADFDWEHHVRLRDTLAGYKGKWLVSQVDCPEIRELFKDFDILDAILRALEYTGYDVQYLKKNGYLYVRQYIGSSLKTNAPQVLSDIGYWSTGACPNGLVCASFVTYYLCNYLPNIEGVDTSAIYEKAKEMGADTSNSSLYYLTTVTTWKRTLDALASESGSGVTKYTDETKAYKNLVPGDVIVFASEGTLKHIAIYAGACDFYSTNGSNSGERHFIIHVGNSRGPEINTVEAMGSAGAKESEPIAWYHIDLPKAPTSGYIEVNKNDPDGKKLSGATFTAVNQSTKESFVIGPTNASGYAKSGELPLGTYVVTETVFPAGYEASGQSSWTVTLAEDTPNMTITINAVNKQSKGTAKIIKATTNGTVIGTYKTDARGTILCELEPGQYTVTEVLDRDPYWECAGSLSLTVTVKAGQTAKVTFTNRLKAAEIIAYKIDALGAPLSGAEFLLEWSEDGQIWKPVAYRASGNVTKGTCTSRGLVDGKLESGRDGVVHFTGLHPQLQYRLTETKAPEGYQLLEKPVYEGGIAPGEKLIVERTVVNAPVFELPMTGSTGSTTATILQLAGAVTLLALLLYFVKKRR